MRALLIIALIGASANAFCGEWSKLAPLPDKEGFAGPFAGVSNGVLLVAGGANFPNKKPWEGGVKVWHDRVFVLERQNGEWIEAGKLPRPLGYGVSVTYRGGVVCVGGSDGQRHYADAFRLEWNDGMIALTRLSASRQRLRGVGRRRAVRCRWAREARLGTHLEDGLAH
jgi:hypothetical protein